MLVLLFLARIRFPRTKSIAAVIRSRYGDKILKMVRKLEKFDFKLRKAKLDIKFLCKCENNDIIPKFLCFRAANKNLKDSNFYKQCHKILLFTEIEMKRSHLRVLQKEFGFYVKNYSQF